MLKLIGWCVLVFVCFIEGTSLAELRTEAIGGCLIVHVREGSGKGPDITKFCNALEKFAANSDGISFQKLYAWAPPFLANSFDMAEKAISAEPNSPGRITGITGKRHTRIIIVPGSEDARIAAASHFVDIVITTTLIDFAQGISGATVLDAFNESGFPENKVVNGIGFRSWLSSARNNITLTNGNLPFPGPTEIPSEEWGMKYVHVPANSIYNFVFAHELAHLKTGIVSGGSGDDIFQREKKVDLFAIRKLNDYVFTNPDGSKGQGIIIPSLVINWFVGMRYYDKINASYFLKTTQSEVEREFVLPEAHTTFDERFPARDWIRRAGAVIDEFEKECLANSKSTACRPGWRTAVRDGRTLIALPTPLDSADLKEKYRSTIAMLIEASSSHFDTIKVTSSRDQLDEETTTYESNIKFPGAESTNIFVTAQPNEAYVSCSLFKGKDQKAADDVYSKIVNNVLSSLPQGWKGDEHKSDSNTYSSKEYTYRQGEAGPKILVRQSKNKRNDELSVRVYFEQE